MNTALGFDIDGDPHAALRLLEDARHSGDASSIECALLIAHGQPEEIDFVPTLIALLGARSHKRHEDVARWLQSLRDPRSVDALYEAALTKHAYFVDHSYAFARKCTWALADIGTAEAHEKLRLLTGSDGSEIAGYAQRRLDHWAEESDRKGPRARKG